MVVKKPMPKDLGGFCAQLYASFQTMEGELRALRSEHEALCRILDKTGIVSSKVWQAELELAGVLKGYAQKESSPIDSPRLHMPQRGSLVDSEVVTTRPVLSRSGSGGPGGRSLRAPSPPAPRTCSPPPVVRKFVRSRSQPRAEPMEPPGVVASPGATKIPLRSKSARMLGTPPQDGPGTARRASEMSSPMPAVPEPEVDLYDCVQKMLDPDTDPVEQQKACRAFQSATRNPAEPPNTWSGPGAPLTAVVRAGRPDLARVLLRARADPNVRDAKGVTPLHLASFDGHAELCRVLLVARADVDACDRHGQTPLFFAPTREVCKTLVERRSDVTMLNRKGQSALHLAGRAGLHEVLEWFHTRVSKTLIDLKDVHGATAKDYARQSGVPRPDNLSASGSPRGSPRCASPWQVRSRVAAPAQGSPGLVSEAGASPLVAATPSAPPMVYTATTNPKAPITGGERRQPEPAQAAAPPATPPAVAPRAQGRAAPAYGAEAGSLGRSTEHFEICDALEVDEGLARSRRASEARHLEAMYDNLGVVNMKQQDVVALEAAVGVAAAAVATAAAAMAAPAAAAQSPSLGLGPDAPPPAAVERHLSDTQAAAVAEEEEEEEEVAEADVGAFGMKNSGSLADLGVLEEDDDPKQEGDEEQDEEEAEGDDDDDEEEVLNAEVDEEGAGGGVEAHGADELAAMGVLDCANDDVGADEADDGESRIGLLEDELDEVF